MLSSVQSLRNPGFFHPLTHQRPLPNFLHLAWRQRKREHCEGGLLSGAWPQRTRSHDPIWLQGKLGNVVWPHSQEVEEQGAWTRCSVFALRSLSVLAGCCSYSSEVGGHFSHQYLSSSMVSLMAFVSSFRYWNAANPHHPDHSFSWSGKLSLMVPTVSEER